MSVNPVSQTWVSARLEQEADAIKEKLRFLNSFRNLEPEQALELILLNKRLQEIKKLCK